jgi:hypothetical protein
MLPAVDKASKKASSVVAETPIKSDASSARLDVFPPSFSFSSVFVARFSRAFALSFSRHYRQFALSSMPVSLNFAFQFWGVTSLSLRHFLQRRISSITRVRGLASKNRRLMMGNRVTIT